MQLNLVCVGERMPSWVTAGYDEYARRLPRECALALREIAPGKRTRHCDIQRIVADEGQRMLAAVGGNAHIVTLDAAGKSWSTRELADALARWQRDGRDIALLVGGPDGLSEVCRQRAAESWSLSRMTFPHPLVRVIVAEQLYRAWTLLNHHPYHR
ncbi:MULTISPECIES: 23S rRNA (pseudouridine(1915)-N(3))-methyltransferase RlmH [Methylococcus]|uniref:Ribosomal RNA large subunit methyltransferase H n=1 Tax=Methylococcus capsulatus TaxID=414 RepID=A0ABZ2F9Y9_METCP|nr:MULTISPECIES: 23S rRNA (pseudouridine(1915)-N(3))-methyltransferase RlmH [Methylococcus]MDF9392679.1 23S rRNA (pseudouridine(1915)-N(3))-methyltransferase RlmH [Methylococcus capsulatus]